MTLVPGRLNFIPLILVIAGLGLLAWSVPGVLRAQANRPVQESSSMAPRTTEELKAQLEELTKSRDVLKDRLDSISRDASSTQWLLSMILAVVGLLALAQGIFAFFSAQNYTKQAEDALKRANDAVNKAESAVNEATQKADRAIATIDALAGDVRSRYPMFADIESARTEAFNQLSSLTAVLDTDQNLYAQSDPVMRQTIFAIESFSAIQFLTPASRSAELLRNLRLLGKFYAGKFMAEKIRADFERSQYYFELALQKFGHPFVVLNDLGWLYSTIAEPLDVAQARSCFEESLRRRPNQQRAPYNLGTILFERGDREKTERARTMLEQAAHQQNWEEVPNQVMQSHISYNLACIYDTLAELTADASARKGLLDESARNLIAAARAGSQPRTVVEADLNGGDLRMLASSREHADRVRAALSDYQAAWQRAGY